MHIWKFLGLLVLATLILIGLLQFDDELSPLSVKLLAQPTHAGQSEAFYYLTGIAVAESDDPAKVGRTIVDGYRRSQSAATGNDTGAADTPQPPERRLPLPGGDDPLFSGDLSLRLAEFLADAQPLEGAIEEHATLLARYRGFVRLRDYRTLTAPSFTEPVPAFEYLSRGNRLEIFRAVVEAQTSETAAVDVLAHNVRALRAQLARADMLIGKMFFTALVSQNIDALWQLGADVPVEQRDALAPLTPQEASLEKAFARELSASHHVFRNMNGVADLLDEDDDSPVWFAKVLFKPNMTTNAMALAYQQQIELSQMPAHEFAARGGEAAMPKAVTNKFRNYVGSVILDIGMPAFRDYVGRMHDLNAKLILLNAALDARRRDQPLDPAQIENPYYRQKDRAALVDEDYLCFDGPLPDRRKYRCLRGAI